MSDKLTSALVTLRAETSIHVGIGQSTGALDLPVARERTTDYPFVPGSGMKGALRVWATERAAMSGGDVSAMFGPSGEDDGGDLQAGALLCSDARLLLLPVRCLSDAYKWVTCPALVSRFRRDCERARVDIADWDMAPLQSGTFFGEGKDGTVLGLEEREFTWGGGVEPALIKAMLPVVGADMAASLTSRLVVLSDSDFSWFARFALPIMARNVLTAEKTSKNLWYEESLSADTIMYALFGERRPGQVGKLVDAIKAAHYLQVGGNETIGQGWLKMAHFTGVSA